jgi:hypothetical protein
VATVVTALNERFAAITHIIRDVLASRIEELQGDSAIIDLLESSISGNVANILHALRHWIPVDNLEPPSAAFEYTRRLAQRGVPVNALVRAYRLGQQHPAERGVRRVRASAPRRGQPRPRSSSRSGTSRGS